MGYLNKDGNWEIEETSNSLNTTNGCPECLGFGLHQHSVNGVNNPIQADLWGVGPYWIACKFCGSSPKETKTITKEIMSENYID